MILDDKDPFLRVSFPGPAVSAHFMHRCLPTGPFVQKAGFDGQKAGQRQEKLSGHGRSLTNEPREVEDNSSLHVRFWDNL